MENTSVTATEVVHTPSSCVLGASGREQGLLLCPDWGVNMDAGPRFLNQ